MQQLCICLDQLCIWQGSTRLILHVVSSTAQYHYFILTLYPLQGSGGCEIAHSCTSQEYFFWHRCRSCSMLRPPSFPVWVCSHQREGFQRRDVNTHTVAPSSCIIILETTLQFQGSSAQAGGRNAASFGQLQSPRWEWREKSSCNSSHSS